MGSERWQSLADCSCLESSRPELGPGGSNPSRSADVGWHGRKSSPVISFLIPPTDDYGHRSTGQTR